jgi:hypothetical protein
MALRRTRVRRQEVVQDMEQATAQESAKRDTRFKPGVSGNPAGAKSRKAKHAEMLARLASDMPAAPSAGDAVLLGHAVDLLLLRATTIEDRTRLVNAAMRIVNGVRRRTAMAQKTF